MKFSKLTLVSLLITASITSLNASADKYEASWDSLSTQVLPEWIVDAKFGIYTHWGVYSVPAHGGPDYAPNLYSHKRDVKGVYSYHKEKYGDLDKVGYTDLVKKFTAPKFNADDWAGVMHNAGAKFAGISVVHHDGFLLWDSKVSRWNAKQMGPKRDIYGEIAKAVRANDMKLVATMHHGRSPGWKSKFLPKDSRDEAKKWDMNNPEFNDFFWDKNDPAVIKKFEQDWQKKVYEIIDNYQPDLLWFDGLRQAMKKSHPSEKTVLETLSYYFNEADKRNQEVVLANKHAGNFNFPKEVGLRSYEGGRDMPEHIKGYYLTDRAIGYPWSYVNNKTYSDGARFHVGFLVDNVSRGGIYLMSLTPKGDGSIPAGELEITQGIGRWLSANGEAIYGTRRYSVYGEGKHLIYKKLKKNKTIYAWDYRNLGADDIRFTQKQNNLYTIVLGMPKSRILTIKTLNSDYDISSENKITSIELLDSDEIIAWSRDKDGLHIKFPKGYQGEFAHAFRIKVAGKLIVNEPDVENRLKLERLNKFTLEAEDEIKVVISD
ncbi:alpha-L-fucosidase [Colwellia piezophila]|uniref:alpha-L-fucosidase n=1 Tax=Colwellia piezophila TaxID=211668 RepID=UPI0003808665|nr:alpha-L-fucosidase [Colwellia piezophila]